MNRNFRKVMALILAVLTLASCFSTMSFAEVDHDNHNSEIVVGKPATTCEDGITDGVKCLACAGNPWIVEPQVIKATHVAGTPAIKGTVTNCTAGYYIETKCTKCPVVLESKWVNEHDYKTVRVEQPYCDVEGTAYKKCSVCGDEVTQPVETRLHSWGTDANSGWITKVVGTCTIDGVDTRKCAQCLRVEERINKAPGHNYVIIEGSDKVPTCTEEGMSVKKACSNCGDVIPGTPINKRSHIDADNDTYCDMCERYITDELPEGCDCPCHHKSGIRKLLFQIAIFFLSIFKVGATCGCGAVHYEIRF